MAEKVTILNTSDPLPFQIDEHVEVGEEARLKHRYLDLRRPGPARNLRLRSRSQPGGPRAAPPGRLRGDRDPHADPFDAGRRPRLRGARTPRPRVPGTRCRSPRSCSSSSCRWAASRSTTRSPAATATRTSGRTASRSSPSWTSRASFVEQDDIIAPRREHRQGSLEAD